MKHINLRLPDALRDRVQSAADQDHRSINSWVVVVIERALAGEDREGRRAD